MGLTKSFKDLKNPDMDPLGTFVENPANKTRTELLMKRGQCDRKQIAETTAKGIAASLEARAIQNIEDRRREPEEMSTIGLEIDIEVQPKTLKQLTKQRKQQEVN